ncbi:MAG: HD domain-containing protein, partial [Defluviitaleaceae bacterium]|nr:HD domain-containing protein [Defluviitaleaceae bacterium]
MRFLPLLFRMKHIKRWGLMWNAREENLSEHTLETALIANLLANIGNEFFGKNHNVEKITTAAIFHDAS